MKKKTKITNTRSKEIRDYDDSETTEFLGKRLSYDKLGLRLPEVPPSQVISIRLPTGLLNELRAMGSSQDVPYQALIKLFLREAVDKKKKRAA